MTIVTLSHLLLRVSLLLLTSNQLFVFQLVLHLAFGQLESSLVGDYASDYIGVG